MNKTALFIVTLLFLSGCATTESVSRPKGKWTEINPKGFIPPNTAIYQGSSVVKPTVVNNKIVSDLNLPNETAPTQQALAANPVVSNDNLLK